MSGPTPCWSTKQTCIKVHMKLYWAEKHCNIYMKFWKDQGWTTPGWHFSLEEKLFMPWAGFEPTSPWLPVGCDHQYTISATMLATWPIWIANGNYVVIPGPCFSPTRWRWIKCWHQASTSTGITALVIWAVEWVEWKQLVNNQTVW